MFTQPITFLAPFEAAVPRSYIMHCCAAAGIRHLVLSDTLIKSIVADPNLIPVVKSEMAAEGLDFVDSHCIFGRYNDLNCPSQELFPVMLKKFKAEFEICNAFGVDTICVHVGNNAWPGQGGYEAAPDAEIAHCADRICRALDALLPEAERLGVTMCIENVWFETNTAERLLEYKAKFPSKALGFCYDAGHANLMARERGEDDCAPKRAWRAIGKQVPWDGHILDKLLDDVVICHLHGNNGLFDLHCNPDDSDIDWKDICAKLHRAPRLKSLQSEVIVMKNNLAMSEVKAAFDRVLD